MRRLDAARKYVALGWSLTAIRRGTKRPPFPWGPYQEQQPDADELGSWFGDGSTHQVAVICGEVSGGLVVVDFDDVAYYERWAEAHPDLAAKLPTVKTRRGVHIYFRSSHRKTRKLKDGNHEWGEVRAEGAYVLAPPSRHPDGGVYEWLIEPGGELPYLELAELGLDAALSEAPALDGEAAEDSEAPEGPDDSEAIAPEDSPHRHQWLATLQGLLASSASSASSDSAAVERAIRESLPQGPSLRNDLTLDLCRRLLAFPGLVGRTWQELVPIAKEWHRLALPTICTKDFQATLADFVHAWKRVHTPKDPEWLNNIVARAKQAPEPSCVAGLGMPKLSLLARICVELQRAYPDRAFFLSGPKAGKLLGITRQEAGNLLSLLVDFGLMEVTEHGNRHRANRYRLTEAAMREAGIECETEEGDDGAEDA